MVNPAALGFGTAALLGAAALLSEVSPVLSPRSKDKWLLHFKGWAGPPSSTQDERVSRTERMVRGALLGSPYLAGHELRVIAQGSSPNNTNVKTVSDLDIVVMSLTLPIVDPYPGDPLPAGFVNDTSALKNQFRVFRGAVSNAIDDAFPHDTLRQKNKCLELQTSSNSRVLCDVVPCFKLMALNQQSKWATEGTTAYEGVFFVSQQGERINSFPEQHLAEGRRKNTATSFRFKQITRIAKTLRDMWIAKPSLLGKPDLPSSYEIEALIYNVPDRILVELDLFEATVRTLGWIITALGSREKTNALYRPNGFQKLFPHQGNGLLVFEPERVAVCRDFSKSMLATICAAS